jgi:hypothetical protein
MRCGRRCCPRQTIPSRGGGVFLAARVGGTERAGVAVRHRGVAGRHRLAGQPRGFSGGGRIGLGERDDGFGFQTRLGRTSQSFATPVLGRYDAEAGRQPRVRRLRHDAVDVPDTPCSARPGPRREIRRWRALQAEAAPPRPESARSGRVSPFLSNAHRAPHTASISVNLLLLVTCIRTRRRQTGETENPEFRSERMKRSGRATADFRRS